MSGVLHPEGPEAAQTYWLRRVLVLLALMILVLVSVGVAGASMGATRQTAPPRVAAADPTPSPSATPTASTSARAANPSATSSAPTAARSASPSPSSSASRSGSAAVVTPNCARKDLKTTLTGKQMLKLSRPAAFTVTVRNDSDETCRVSLARTDFELKVTAGKKLLWSSRSCNTATFVVAAKLDLDQSMSWAMLWDGRGTVAGCALPGAELKRGTYLATATVAGAKAAELPITLRP